MKIFYENKLKIENIYGTINNNEIVIENNKNNLIGIIIYQNDFNNLEILKKYSLVIIKDNKNEIINKVYLNNTFLTNIHFIKYNSKINNYILKKDKLLIKNIDLVKFFNLFFKQIIILYLFYFLLNFDNYNFNNFFKIQKDFLNNFPLGIKANKIVSEIFSFLFINILNIYFIILFNKISLLVILFLLFINNLINIKYISLIEFLKYISLPIEKLKNIFKLIIDKVLLFNKHLFGLLQNTKFDNEIKKFTFYKINNKYKPIISLFIILMNFFLINILIFYIYFLIYFYFIFIFKFIILIFEKILEIDYNKVLNEYNTNKEKKIIFKDSIEFFDGKNKNIQFYFIENYYFENNILKLIFNKINFFEI